MTMRDPKPNDLIDFIVWVQPELDRDAAAKILMNDDIWEGVEQQWRRTRGFSEALLEHHLICQKEVGA